MSYAKARKVCLFSNRWIIYLFSLYGLFSGSTFAYVVALTFWIWLADFTKFELNFLAGIKTHISKYRSKIPHLI